jgi:hypothetical protein
MQEPPGQPERNGRRGSCRPAAADGWPGCYGVLTLLGLAATAWLDHLLRLADRPAVTWSQEGGNPYELAAISAATSGR